MDRVTEVIRISTETAKDAAELLGEADVDDKEFATIAVRSAQVMALQAIAMSLNSIEESLANLATVGIQTWKAGIE